MIAIEIPLHLGLPGILSNHTTSGFCHNSLRSAKIIQGKLPCLISVHSLVPSCRSQFNWQAIIETVKVTFGVSF